MTFILSGITICTRRRRRVSMTVEYSFFEEWKLVWVNTSDTVTFEQMTACLKSLSRDPRYRPPMNKLVDLRNCRDYALSRQEAERFKQQQQLRDAGDKEAQMSDEDFVEALEYGMPPTCGFGMSERVFSYLMNKSSRECQIFPLLKPKKLS